MATGLWLARHSSYGEWYIVENDLEERATLDDGSIVRFRYCLPGDADYCDTTSKASAERMAAEYADVLNMLRRN